MKTKIARFARSALKGETMDLSKCSYARPVYDILVALGIQPKDHSVSCWEFWCTKCPFYEREFQDEN